MASVDGRRSYQASSDEVFQHTCGPCKEDGETIEAKFLCEICQVYLCLGCRNDHKTFKATKNHKLISAHLTESESSSTTEGDFAIWCDCHQKRAVGVYCENHAVVVCHTCDTIKHRNCKTCLIKDKVTKDNKKELKELMDRAIILRAKIESCRQDGITNRKIIDDSAEECKNEITIFRREINKILDKKETEHLADLASSANQKLQVIEKQIAAMEASQNALDTDLGIIEKANKTNRDEIIFSSIVKFSKSLSEYDSFFKDIRVGMNLLSLKFQQNKKLNDVLKRLEGLTLGKVETRETRSSEQNSVVILGMKVKSKEEINLKVSDDDETPCITGCTFLSNSRILLCDYFNCKVKLLDSDTLSLKSLKLSDKPYNVAAVSEKVAMITFGEGNKDLQYIYTQPELKLGEKITLPNDCFGLQVVNDEIYTICHRSSGHDEIWRLDRAGNIIRKIILTQRDSCRSDYLGLCLVNSNPRVYITASSPPNHSRVTCFQLDGKMVYQYEDDRQLKGPEGIYVDSVGNSLVCGPDSHNVVVITADGRNQAELLTIKDITRPRCIDYRPEDHTLIVGCEHSSKLYVYKLIQ